MSARSAEGHVEVAPAPGAGADRRGPLLLATAALLWAAIGLGSPWFFEQGVRPEQVAFWRAAAAASAFVVHASIARRWPRDRHAVRTLALFGVVGVAFFYWVLQVAIESGGVSLAWLLLYTAPAWVTIGAPLLLKQPGSRRMVGLVALTVVGAALVALGGGEGLRVTPLSVTWGLLAGLAYATWYFVTQRAGTGPVATGAVALPVGAVLLLPLAGWPGWELALWLGLFGVVTSYLPALAFHAGMQRTPAARASVIATVEPVFALAFAWLAYGERLAPLAIVGAVLVMGAAVAASRAR